MSIAFIVIIGWLFYLGYYMGYSWVVVGIFGFYLVSTIFTMFIFMQKRHSGAKLSWIFVLTIFPGIGHIIFIIFGQRYRHRKPASKYQNHWTFKDEKFHNEKVLSILRKQSNISKRPAYNADIELFSSGAEAFEKLFDSLKKAKKFIHMQYYIIKPGEIYEHLKSILIQKSKEGIEVKLMIDDFGKWALPWYEIKYLRDNGIEIAIFGSVHFPFINSENGYRMHRKTTIIDGIEVHTGGINIANEYAHMNKRYGFWHDYQVMITGKATRSHSLLFLKDWEMVTDKKLDPKEYVIESKIVGESTVVMVDDTPEVEESILSDSMVSWILNAKKSIKLTTPYFIPPKAIFSALRTAALSGVDVTIYIPGKPDKKTILIASKYYASILSKYGVKIKTLDNILIHSKIGIFDDEYAYFGTANIDTRSLYSQFETVNLVEGKLVKDLQKLIKIYDRMSYIQDFPKQNWLAFKIKQLFIMIFSPLM